MTKLENTETRGASIKTPWYKKAALPWGIVAILVAGSLGFIGGWMGHINYTQDAKAEAHELVTLSKAGQ